MLYRIVKMTFDPRRVDAFLEFFHQRKERIAGFPGCRSLKLMRDRNHTNVIFTLSVWDDESDLESYRHSDLFEDTWKQTKAMFSDKPRAWSVDCLVSLPKTIDND